MKDTTCELLRDSKIRVAIRGFAGPLRQLIFEDRLELTTEEIPVVMPRLANEHCDRLDRHGLYMVEFEFLDEPDPTERFFRFGSDPGGMVAPLQCNLESTTRSGRVKKRRGPRQRR
jgi:hypothetical protein